MALITKLQPSMLFLLLAVVTIMISSITNATDCIGSGSISVYWGQGANSVVEGTLKETCDSELYNIVIIDGLIVRGAGHDPRLNLENHCGSVEHPCTELQSEIEYCQKEKNIKIFLSINSVVPTARISNTQDNEEEDEAKKLADYLLKNYLSGQPGPLGSVSLDGIDLQDIPGSSNLKWDDLVKAINASTTERKIYLSASPQCVYPDAFLGNAIKTGLFDYIWVEFYNPNPDCIYSGGGATKLLNAWKKWTSNVPNSLIFLGLAASEEAATAGYIPPEDLKSEVLPTAKEASNYGGVMIWNRYYDVKNNYTAQIKDDVPKVCRCVCDTEPVASASVYGRVESM